MDMDANEQNKCRELALYLLRHWPHSQRDPKEVQELADRIETIADWWISGPRELVNKAMGIIEEFDEEKL